jgi:SAM-dependent methyltransferase
MTKPATHDHIVQAPSPWVERFLPGVPKGGEVLDVACGAGRHLRLALEAGYRVVGLDRELSGVEDLKGTKGVELIEADLESGARFPLEGRRFAGVIVVNYLYRPLFPALIGAVADDGVLIYQTFALGHERFGKPSNPDYLLKPNELIDAVAPDLVVVDYEYGLVPKGPRIVGRIAACGSRHPWADQQPYELGSP